MNFPRLTFPLTVDCTGREYWIGASGPYKYGEAVTAFLIGEDIGDIGNGGIPLLRELEVCLKTFCSYLQPYAKAPEVTDELFRQLERSSAKCTVSYGYHSLQGSIVLVERYTFLSLRDFLYVELGKAILCSNAPRQCRLCGGWFFHEQGDRALYCERIAPGETERTCREAGARVVFEKKIQNEDAWKLYKRAYKKYYARYMKGNMSKDKFKAWAEQAALDRDTAIKQIDTAADAETKTRITERLLESLNRQ